MGKRGPRNTRKGKPSTFAKFAHFVVKIERADASYPRRTIKTKLTMTMAAASIRKSR